MRSLRRLRKLAEAYGGDLSRWPASERIGAQQLCETSADARACLERARQLDRLLDQADARLRAQSERAADEEVALERLRAHVAAQIAVTPRQSKRIAPSSPWNVVSPYLALSRPVLVGTVCTLLIVIGFGLGSRFPTRHASGDVISVLQLSTLGGAFAE